jgi:uncharacterized integral membrane protein
MDQPRNVNEGADRQRNIFATVVGGIIAVIVVIFMVQNTEEVQVQWLGLSWSMPLWLLIVIALLLGTAIGWLARWRHARRRRKG